MRPSIISAPLHAALLIALALPTTSARAGNSPAVASSLFIERPAGSGGSLLDRLAPTARLQRGDRVVTVLRWDRAGRPGLKLTSAVPGGLQVQSASREGLEISSDGGGSWQVLPDGTTIPPGVTHLRWPLGRMPGTLSYRAIVR